MKFVIVLSVFMLYQCERTLYLFEPAGFVQFMKRQFGTLEHALNNNVHIQGNTCPMREFSTKHHLIPQSYLFKKLMLSLYELVHEQYDNNDNEDGNDPQSLALIEMLNNEIKANAGNDRTEIQYSNADALSLLSDTIVWTESNLVCGPEESKRKHKAKDYYDYYLVPDDTKLLLSKRVELLDCEQLIVKLFKNTQEKQRELMDKYADSASKNCTRIHSKETQRLAAEIKRYPKSAPDATKDRIIEEIKLFYLKYNTLKNAFKYFRTIIYMRVNISCRWRKKNNEYIEHHCVNYKRSFLK